MKFKTLTVILICIVLHLGLQGILPGQEKSKKNWKNWEEVKKDFKAPGLKVMWDEEAGVPRMIMGLNVAPSLRLKQVIDEKSVSEIAFRFLEKYEKLFNIPVGAAKKKRIKQFQNKWYVILQTFYKGIPIYKGKVGFTLDQNGTILSYSSDYNPEMKLKIKPVILEKEAVEIAQKHHKPGIDLPVIIKEAYLMIYPEVMPKGSKKYRLTWYIFLGTEAGHLKVDRVFFIDALTGKKIKDFYPHPFSITGVVRGEVYHEHSTDTVAIEPFEHLEVSASGYSANTAASGNYTLNPGSGNHMLTMRLEGQFVRVQCYDPVSRAGQDIVHKANVTNPGTHNFTWTSTNSNPDDGDGLNVFWHANRLHDDYYQAVLGLSWKNDWTGTTRMNYLVNRVPYENAHAGNPIVIYSDLEARNCDLIYHETTHNVLHNIYGGDYIGFDENSPSSLKSEGYAFDEGFSDYVACSFNNDPQYGEGVHKTRNCDNTLQYPGISYDWVGHDGGQLISGVAWDLWNRQGLNHNDADVLLFDALHLMATLPRPYYFSNPNQNQSNYLTSLLESDDNDNNMTNGTPHDRQIFQAFRNHDLLPVDVFCKDDSLDDGNVPSQGAHWNNPDIWVRNNKDNGLVHQKPIYNQVNYIYVRVRNLGYLNADTITVKAYRANPAGGIPWPSDWNFIGQTIVSNLSANSDTVASPIPWTPTGNAVDNGCLLVRLECDQDMITEEGNVKYDNNTARKDMPTITVISPNGGECWKLGSTQKITWEAAGICNNVNLVLWKDRAYVGLIKYNLDPYLGSYPWTVGQLNNGTFAAPGSGYKIRVREIAGSRVFDDSDASFSIGNIEVTSPNGGEEWTLGSTQEITWEAAGICNKVKIVLWKNDVHVGLIKSNLDPYPGSYTWTVGQYGVRTAPGGCGYTIRVREEGGSLVFDDSNAFTLVDPGSPILKVHYYGINDNGNEGQLEKSIYSGCDYSWHSTVKFIFKPELGRFELRPEGGCFPVYMRKDNPTFVKFQIVRRGHYFVSGKCKDTWGNWLILPQSILNKINSGGISVTNTDPYQSVNCYWNNEPRYLNIGDTGEFEINLKDIRGKTFYRKVTLKLIGK